MKTVSIREQFKQPLEKVWEIVANNSNYKWRSDLSNLVVHDDLNFSEFDKNGFETKFSIRKKENCKLYEFDIVNANISGQWTGEFREVDAGITEIIFTEKITANNKFLNPLLGIFIKKQQKRYIADLRQELEKKQDD